MKMPDASLTVRLLKTGTIQIELQCRDRYEAAVLYDEMCQDLSEGALRARFEVTKISHHDRKNVKLKVYEVQRAQAEPPKPPLGAPWWRRIFWT